MKLDPNWLYSDLIDFEYKKYRLLAYLQSVNGLFRQNRVFPAFKELLRHRSTLTELQTRKQQLHNHFPQRLTGIEGNFDKLSYQADFQTTPEMQEIDALMEYSLPKFDESIKSGSTILELVGEQMTIEPIGITPLYLNEGYLMLQCRQQKQTLVYEYSIGLVQDVHTQRTNVSTSFVSSFSFSFSTTHESLKRDLTKTRLHWSNPAAYLAEYAMDVPVQETLLPVATQLLVKTIEETQKGL